jgi:hypothetical protein
MPGNRFFKSKFPAAACARPRATLATAIAVSSVLAVISTAVVAIGAPSTTQATNLSSEQQALTAEVSSEVSWGSADGCQQNIQTDDFGQLTPDALAPALGAFAALPAASASVTPSGAHVWVGCVTSNAPLASIVAQGTANMEDSAGNVLPIAGVAIGITNPPGGPTAGSCAIAAAQTSAGSCSLPDDDSTVRTLVARAYARVPTSAYENSPGLTAPVA